MEASCLFFSSSSDLLLYQKPLAAQDATTSKGAAAVFSFHLIHKKGPVKTQKIPFEWHSLPLLLSLIKKEKTKKKKGEKNGKFSHENALKRLLRHLSNAMTILWFLLKFLLLNKFMACFEYSLLLFAATHSKYDISFRTWPQTSNTMK